MASSACFHPWTTISSSLWFVADAARSFSWEQCSSYWSASSRIQYAENSTFTWRWYLISHFFFLLSYRYRHCSYFSKPRSHQRPRLLLQVSHWDATVLLHYKATTNSWTGSLVSVQALIKILASMEDWASRVQYWVLTADRPEPCGAKRMRSSHHETGVSWQRKLILQPDLPPMNLQSDRRKARRLIFSNCFGVYRYLVSQTPHCLAGIFERPMTKSSTIDRYLMSVELWVLSWIRRQAWRGKKTVRCSRYVLGEPLVP